MMAVKPKHFLNIDFFNEYIYVPRFLIKTTLASNFYARSADKLER